MENEGESTALWRLGEYQLLEALGGGPTATVFKARHVRLNRMVAVKLLREGFAGDPQSLGRFRREMAAVGGVEHPNVVWASDAGEHDGVPYIVMEFLEGRTLAQVLCDHGPLATADACELARQAALGLQCIHEHGLVHRDVKPSNLFLTSDGGVKLLDMGLARPGRRDAPPAEEITEPAAVLGTVDYMAPEQATDSRRVDIRADVYGLGCTLYELLTGSPPYAGPEHDTPVRKLLAHAQAPLPSLHAVRPDASRTLIQTLGRMLAKSPDDRFQTPGELAAALAPLAQGHDLSGLARRPAGAARAPSQAPLPPSTVRGRATIAEKSCIRKPPRTPLWSARKAVWMAAAAALTVALVVAGVAVHLRTRDAAGLAAAARPADTAADTASPVPRDDRAELASLRDAVEKAASETSPEATSEIRGRLAAFAGERPGTPERLEAVRLVARLVGPADKLQSSSIPADERSAAGLGPTGKTPAGLVAVLGDSRLKHWNGVQGIDFSPDGSMLASAGHDGAIRVWDAETGRQIARLQADPRSYEAVRFVPDGKTLLAAAPGGWLWSWDTGPWKTRRGIKSEGAGWDGNWNSVWLAFSPDGKSLAVAAKDHSVLVIETRTGKAIHALRGHGGQVHCVAFDRGGTRIASGDKNGTALVWDAASGEKLKQVEPGRGEIWSVALSPDGKLLATGHDDPTVTLHDLEAGSPPRSIADCSGRASLAFSPDGALLVAGSTTSALAAIDVKSGQVVKSFVSPGANWGLSPAFSPDGTTLACGFWDPRVAVWDAATGADRIEWSGHLGGALSVAASPDGSLVASGGRDGKAVVWDLATGKPVRTFAAQWWVQSLAFADSGASLFVSGQFGQGGSKTVGVWSLATGRRQRAVTVSGNSWFLPGPVLSPARSLMANADESHVVSLWDLALGRERHILRGHQGHVTAMAFSPDGRIVASAGEDGRVRLWNADDGAERRTLSTAPAIARSLAFSPDGAVLACGLSDSTIGLWDPAGGDRRGSLQGHAANRFGVRALAFAPDGGRLASASGDGSVRLWDGRDGKPLKTIAVGPATGVVNGVAFTPEGRHLLSANENGTVYVLRLDAD